MHAIWCGLPDFYTLGGRIGLTKMNRGGAAIGAMADHVIARPR